MPDLCPVCARQHDARGCRGPRYRVAKAHHDDAWHIFRRQPGQWLVVCEPFLSKRAAENHLRRIYAEGEER